MNLYIIHVNIPTITAYVIIAPDEETAIKIYKSLTSHKSSFYIETFDLSAGYKTSVVE